MKYICLLALFLVFFLPDSPAPLEEDVGIESLYNLSLELDIKTPTEVEVLNNLAPNLGSSTSMPLPRIFVNWVVVDDKPSNHFQDKTIDDYCLVYGLSHIRS